VCLSWPCNLAGRPLGQRAVEAEPQSPTSHYMDEINVDDPAWLSGAELPAQYRTDGRCRMKVTAMPPTALHLPRSCPGCLAHPPTEYLLLTYCHSRVLSKLSPVPFDQRLGWQQLAASDTWLLQQMVCCCCTQIRTLAVTHRSEPWCDTQNQNPAVTDTDQNPWV